MFTRQFKCLTLLCLHCATGQSGILFGKPPCLNQCIALNRALQPPLLVSSSSLNPITMNYSYRRLNSTRGMFPSSPCLMLLLLYSLALLLWLALILILFATYIYSDVFLKVSGFTNYGITAAI